MMQQIQSVCGECRGQGERINPKFLCKQCNGKKVNKERKILEVHIDKGKMPGVLTIFMSSLLSQSMVTVSSYHTNYL